MKITAQIADGKMFSNTFTINGRTVKLSEYFDEAGDVFEYYHKQVGSYTYICKFHKVAGEGIEVMVNDVTVEIAKKKTIEEVKKLILINTDDEE